MNQDEQRRIYESEQGREALERQMLERERVRGCTCAAEDVLQRVKCGGSHHWSCKLYRPRWLT